MGHFKLISKKKLIDITPEDTIPESDFATMISDGHLIQFEYIEDEYVPEPYEVKPGIWTIQKTNRGLVLEATSFTGEDILESFISTQELQKRINCFFTKLDVYKKYGIPVPRRAALLYGPPGTGKSTAVIKVCQEYNKDNEIAVIIWSTDKLDPSEVKDFFKRFKYVGVKKVILVAEDIGGIEMEKVRMRSTSSLLSLLDNKEKIFTIPIFIIATTNFPENLLGNITNRPGRFDDKLEVGYPNADARYQLLKFFSKGEIAEDILQKIKDKKYSEFSAAHISEIVIRSAIYDQQVVDVMNNLAKEIQLFKKDFEKQKKSLGIITSDHDDDY